MQGIPACWYYFGQLTKQTFRVWWRVLPKIVAAWTAGWLCLNATMALTAVLQQDHPWLVVVLFSFGLVGYLAGIIIAIRLAGEPAGLWDRLPPGAARIGRDEPLVRVLSQALLPFVGVYSVFGGIQKATYSMYIFGSVAVGYSDPATTLLDPVTPGQRLLTVGLLVVCYLLKRGLEATAERTGFAVFGVLGAMAEGVFSVVLVFGGSRMLGDLGIWLSRREFWGWFLQIGSWLAERLARIHDLIPDFIGSAWNFVFEQLWPMFTEGMMAPLLWLAVAGLTYGTYTLSAAELWRQDPTVDDGAGSHSRLFTALRRRTRQASSTSRAVTLEFIEVFVGDLEDRFIPFIQSLRHVLRVGLPFMASYVLLYAISSALPHLVWRLFRLILGGRPFEFWFRMSMPVDLVSGLIGEPVRLCLLAVAMAFTVSATRERLEDESRIGARAPGLIRLDPVTNRVRVLRALPVLLVTLACLLASGGIARVAPTSVGEQVVRVPAGESQWLIPGLYMSIDEVRAGRQIFVKHEPEPLLRTQDVFLLVNVWAESRAAKETSVDCRLVADPRSGLRAPIPAVQSSTEISPNPGFGRVISYVFERPADGLMGAMVHCRVFHIYRAYDRAVLLDLGIDEERQAGLAAQTGGVDIALENPLEVLR